MTGIALITGANRGIGFETARQLGQLGVTTLIGSRDPDNGKRAAEELAAEGIDAEPLTVDVTSVPSIEAATERVSDEHGRLDVLVNVSSRMGSLADQGNPTSPYYGLIVPAYQTSKAALNGITVTLAKALRGTAIKVNSVCPGWVQTDLGGPGNRAAALLPAHEAARIVVAMATLGDDGPSGHFLDQDGTVPW
jgi:NAD(P)-dependent dehydrogenase (short-subunit alcohol dehydrogenase family)